MVDAEKTDAVVAVGGPRKAEGPGNLRLAVGVDAAGNIAADIADSMGHRDGRTLTQGRSRKGQAGSP